MVNTYKYQKSHGLVEKSDIVFLRVIKTPYWSNAPSQICEDLPVDALTWTDKCYLKYDENGLYTMSDTSIVIENNQFCINFDPSCFEVLHTSTQKLNRDDT